MRFSGKQPSAAPHAAGGPRAPEMAKRRPPPPRLWQPAACPGLVLGADEDPRGTDSAGVILVPSPAAVTSPQVGAKSCRPCTGHRAVPSCCAGQRRWGEGGRVFYGSSGAEKHQC